MIEELTPEEVRDRIGDAGVQIVDIRPRFEFERGHIPGAMNIPLAELPRRIDEVEWGDDIVVACPIGQSSIQAARLIESYEGVDRSARVSSMAGGYEAWHYELASDQESPIDDTG